MVKTAMNRSYFILVCLLLNLSAFAQTQKAPSMPDLFKEMELMQQQLMQQFRNMSPGSNFQWDTSFSFRIDTTFGDMDSGFFMSPFGRDTSFFRDFFGNDLFSQDMSPFEFFFRDFPENDENSALKDKNDGLLPEERLRLLEEAPETPPSGEEKPHVQESKKPKIKTIRI
ncbi:MAG: hypothetical protein JNJ57_05625 [Saprospiraceae bacterium]|nr:hypothetical protein [Saprospiraceae bacterium]